MTRDDQSFFGDDDLLPHSKVEKNAVCYMKESKGQNLSMRNHEDYVKYGQPCNGHGTSYHQCRQLELDGGDKGRDRLQRCSLLPHLQRTTM